MNSEKNKQLAPQVVLAQHGNKDAFKKLYSAYYKNICFICKLMTCDSVAAMNLTGHVFVEMFGSVDKLNDYTAFEQWLYSVALNMCKAEASDAENDIQTLSRDMQEATRNIRRSITDGDSFAFERTMMNLLEKLIAALPYDIRIVFLYKNFAQIDNDKIALLEKKTEDEVVSDIESVNRFMSKIGDRLRSDGVDISPFAKDWNSTLCYLASRVFVPDSVHSGVSEALGIDVNPFR